MNSRSAPRIVLASAIVALMVGCGTARADTDDDPTTDQVVCGAFKAGQSQQQIAGGLGTNDHRWNTWRAQQRVNGTILGGECG